MRYIPVGKDHQAIVDDEDYEWAKARQPWGLHSLGYAVRAPTWKGSKFLMHRELLNVTEDYVVDHINGNKLDNRRENLRICTNAENSRNRVKSTLNTSGYKGVSYKKEKNYIRKKPWNARIKVDYKEIYLGHFQTKEEAAKAYNEAAIKYFGEFAKLNEVD
jgi:hypothetical protein